MTISAQKMQQLASEANTQINTMFSDILPDAGEEVFTKITAETNALMQGWQQAMTTFQELKVSDLTKFPELGPLFRHPREGRQAEEDTGSSGPMEVETV